MMVAVVGSIYCLDSKQNPPNVGNYDGTTTVANYGGIHLMVSIAQRPRHHGPTLALDHFRLDIRRLFNPLARPKPATLDL